MNWQNRLLFVSPQLLDRLILVLAALFVLVDWLNGLLRHSLGSLLPLSAAFKALLLALLLWRGWQLCRSELRLPLLLLVLMLPGPLYIKWLTGHPYLLSDLQLIAKAGAMLLALAYFAARAKTLQQDYLRYVDAVALAAFMLLLLNTVLGTIGYGGTAYQPMEQVSQKFLGIKGYFVSTNELSALLLVLSGWLLCRSWQRRRWAYPLIALAAFFIAALMLTKTGLFGILLLVLLTPLLVMDRRQWQQAKPYLLAAGLVVVVLTALLLYHLTALLQWVGLYDKLQFAYQQRGLSGILLSSRDFYLQRNFALVAEHYPHWLQVLGVGQGGVRLLLKKYFIELDFFDLLLFYGVAGALLFCLSFLRLFSLLWSRMAKSELVLPLALLNLLLLAVALLAGHVLTSGMLWLPWALVNAAVLVNRAPSVLTTAMPQTVDSASTPVVQPDREAR
ncbi:MAG: O-antigen ligase family protein [Alishewanella aestuarii]